MDRRLEVNRLTSAEQEEYVARYDGEIVAADRLVDRLLRRLEKLGVAHTTVVVILSDHGETLFEREWTMDHGTRPYDEQARVPLVIHLPGDRLAGRRVAGQVSLLDVAPTVLDIFDVEPAEPMPGRSLMALARGESDGDGPRPAFITARCEPDRVPHISAPLLQTDLVRAIRLPTVKLVEFPTVARGRHPELFDLVTDPTEQTDLSDHSTELAASLHDALERWQDQSGSTTELEPLELEPEVEAALRELGYLED
jgi:arylsulfatase A-like enzyme